MDIDDIHKAIAVLENAPVPSALKLYAAGPEQAALLAKVYPDVEIVMNGPLPVK